MAGEKSGEGDTNQLIISEGKNNNKIRDCKTIVVYCIWVVVQIFLFAYCIASLNLISIEGTLAAVDFAIVLLLIIGIILSIFGTCVLVRHVLKIQ